MPRVGRGGVTADGEKAPRFSLSENRGALTSGSAIRTDGAFVMPYPNRTARLRKRFRFFSLTVFWQVYILNMAKGTILL